MLRNWRHWALASVSGAVTALSIVGSANTAEAQYLVGNNPGCCGNAGDLIKPRFKPGSILPPRPWFPSFHSHAHPHYYGPSMHGHGTFWGGPMPDPGFGGFAPQFGGFPAQGGCCGDGGMQPFDGGMQHFHEGAHFENAPYTPTLPMTPQQPGMVPHPQYPGQFYSEPQFPGPQYPGAQYPGMYPGMPPLHGEGGYPPATGEPTPIRAQPVNPTPAPSDSFRPRTPESGPQPAPRTPSAAPSGTDGTSRKFELPGNIEFTNEVIPLPHDARRPGVPTSSTGRFHPVPGAARAWYATSETVLR